MMRLEKHGRGWVAVVLVLASTASALISNNHGRTLSTYSARSGLPALMPRSNLTPLRSAALPAADAAAVTTAPRPGLSEDDAWVANLDLEAFRKEIRGLGKELESNQGPDDLAHIKKICRWSNGCTALGLATMGLGVNPVSIFALSLGIFSRWTTIAHHTCHGGYNNNPADPKRFFTSKGFALGSLKRRVGQWFDWMLPEAWNVEHNNLHHYRLGEKDDPDLVERNLKIIRSLKAPMFIKYGAVAFLMSTWKWFYYAPNTYKELKIAELRRKGQVITDDDGASEAFTLKAFVDGHSKKTKWFSFPEFFSKVVGPYLVGHFFLLPLPLALIGGKAAFLSAVANLALADVVTNIHAFIAIATNHCGEDLYRFERGCAPNSGTFYLRQVISSANFRTGGDVNDFMHGWLNYQVEHHLWPQLSALSYQRAQPRVKAICEKHGVPYVQESVWIRLKKTIDIMVGKTSMKLYPDAYELEKDIMIWNTNKAAAHKGNEGAAPPVTAASAPEPAVV